MLFKLHTLKESDRLRYLYFFYLYAMQGIPAGFALTALANYLIGRGITAIAIGNFDALIGLPWVLQFIWGPVIDRYQQSIMGHRKHWILGSQVLTVIIVSCLLFIKSPTEQIGIITLIFVTHSIAASVQDAAVDATAISIVPESQMGKTNAFMRLGMLLGTAIGAAGFSSILHAYGFFYAALCQSLLLLLFTMITYLIKINRDDSYAISTSNHVMRFNNVEEVNPGMNWLFKQLFRGIVRKNSLQTFILIALVYLCLSVFIRSLSFHLIHNLHWNDNQLSVLQGSWGSLVSMIVILTGGIIADKIGPAYLQNMVLIGLCLFFIAFGCIGFLWIYKPVSATGVILFSFADPLFSVSSIPILMGLCLKKVEGSQFTAYMAFVNLCDVLGAYISGWAMTITTAPVVGIACGTIIIIVMIVKRLVTGKTQYALKIQ